MSISKRGRVLAAVLGSGIVVASSACGVDSTAPNAAPTATKPSVTQERMSAFVPAAASKALIGVADGVYTVTINPAYAQKLALGPNHLDLPANAICDMGSSGYGSYYWDKPCTPETRLITLVVTVRDAATDHPQVDFAPAMRFNPLTKVQLYFYVPNVSPTAAKNWNIFYCSTMLSSSCRNEAIADPDLTTYVDYSASVLFRRIKHFSGYKVDSGYLITE